MTDGTVWLATAGEYSDHRVVVVFTREEEARSYELADDVEERVLHDGPIEVRTWWTLRWSTRIEDREGSAHHAANPLTRGERQDFDNLPKRVEHTWSENRYDGYALTVSGWEPEGVHKVYGEQRAQFIATDGASAAAQMKNRQP